MKNNRCESIQSNDRKMQDQLSFICTHYTHKTITVKKLIKRYTLKTH